MKLEISLNTAVWFHNRQLGSAGSDSVIQCGYWDRSRKLGSRLRGEETALREQREKAGTEDRSNHSGLQKAMSHTLDRRTVRNSTWHVPATAVEVRWKGIRERFGTNLSFCKGVSDHFPQIRSMQFRTRFRLWLGAFTNEQVQINWLSSGCIVEMARGTFGWRNKELSDRWKATIHRKAYMVSRCGAIWWRDVWITPPLTAEIRDVVHSCVFNRHQEGLNKGIDNAPSNEKRSGSYAVRYQQFIWQQESNGKRR